MEVLDDAPQSTPVGTHELNSVLSLLQHHLLYKLVQPQQQPQLPGPHVVRVLLPEFERVLLLCSSTGALMGTEPLATVNSQQILQNHATTDAAPPSIQHPLHQHHITHNLIPPHLQASSLPPSLNGTPGYQPALIAVATANTLMQIVAPLTINDEALLRAVLTQTQQQFALSQIPGLLPPSPPPPVISLTVQDRVPSTLPVYNGINPLFPGVKQVHGNFPPVFVVENFLTPEECDSLIQVASNGWSPAPVVGKGAGEISPSRTSSTYYLRREDFPEYMTKITELTGKPVQHFELPQVGRYLPTQQYRHVSHQSCCCWRN